MSTEIERRRNDSPIYAAEEAMQPVELREQMGKAARAIAARYAGNGVPRVAETAPEVVAV